MATSTFAAKITNLVGGTIDDDACDDWMTEGAKEIINQLPPALLRLCTTNTTFTSQVAGSESSGSGNLLNTGKVLNVFAGSYSCRVISNLDKYKAEDSDNILYATATDPVYYIERSYINVLPSGISTSRYEEVQYPTVNNGSDNTIALFPDEAESLVVLYAAIRQLLQYQSTMSSSFNSDITDAFTATNTELDETQAICDLINTQSDSAVTALGNMATEIALANDEIDLSNPEVDLAKAEILETVTLIDGSIDTAAGLITTAVGKVNAQIILASAEVDTAADKADDEDTELVGAFSSAGQNYLQEAQAQLGEASGHVSEINARVAQVNGQIAVANGYLSTASGYNQVGQAYLGTAGAYGNQASGFLNAAQGFANELSQKIAIANGYIAEASARLGADSAKYQWYGDQYAKLSAEYARGLALVKGTAVGGGA